jgi:hypothetical protein
MVHMVARLQPSFRRRRETTALMPFFKPHSSVPQSLLRAFDHITGIGKKMFAVLAEAQHLADTNKWWLAGTQSLTVQKILTTPEDACAAAMNAVKHASGVPVSP